MWEGIVVGVVVIGAVFFVARSMYKSATGKSKTCGCGLDSCPMNESGECDPDKGAVPPESSE